MKKTGGRFAIACAVLGVGLLGATGQAMADADYMVFAGSSHGPNTAQLTPGSSPSCTTCPASVSGVPMTTDAVAPNLAMLGVGMVGSEGRKRGGGELFTILGLGNEQTTGYTSFVTYGGLDYDRVFAQIGLGLGRYWGVQRDGFMSSFAGNARAELGVRLTPRWIVVGRTDIIANNTEVSPFVTLGLQFLPYARVEDVRAPARLR
jgi:hypothetical protein